MPENLPEAVTAEYVYDYITTNWSRHGMVGGNYEAWCAGLALLAPEGFGEIPNGLSLTASLKLMQKGVDPAAVLTLFMLTIKTGMAAHVHTET